MNFFTGYKIQWFNTIPCRVNIRIRCLHIFINKETAGNTNFKSGIFRKFHVRIYTNCYNRKFTWQFGSVLKFNTGKFSILSQKFRNTVISNNVCLFTADMILHKFSHLPVKKSKKLREHFDYCNLNSGKLQSFTSFNPYKSAADYNSFCYLFIITDFSQVIGVLHWLKSCNTVKIRSGDCRFFRDWSCCNDKLVIGESLL